MEWFIGALIVAIIFALIFSKRKKKAKAAEGILWFFMLFLFPLWAFSIWVPPIGPVFQGIAWVDIIVLALLISLGIIIFTPKEDKDENLSKLDKYGKRRKSRAMSGLLWMFTTFMVVLIAVGYLQIKA